MKHRVVALGLLLAMAGCATTASLPQTPAEVKLGAGRFEQGYWPRYAASAVFAGRSFESVFNAARAALVENEFNVVREDPAHGVIMGEQGPSLFYWNVMAGVYIGRSGSDIEVQVVTVGSKDIGFVEIVPSSLPSRILGSLRAALEGRGR
jgi:hypothetical protein